MQQFGISSGRQTATGFHTQVGFQINPLHNPPLWTLLLTCFIQVPLETYCRAINLIPSDAGGYSALAESQLAIWLALSSLLSAVMAYVRHAVTHSAVPLPAQPMSVCICACGCACACLCVCEGEIYLPSTRGSICGVCAVGKRLSLWLFSLYELQSLSPAGRSLPHYAPRISPALDNSAKPSCFCSGASSVLRCFIIKIENCSSISSTSHVLLLSA